MVSVDYQWNDVLHYEPVGCRVIILTESGEQVLAYRKDPTKNRGQAGAYINAETDKPIDEKVLKWMYP